jgi:hypothetical protein
LYSVKYEPAFHVRNNENFDPALFLDSLAQVRIYNGTINGTLSQPIREANPDFYNFTPESYLLPMERAFPQIKIPQRDSSPDSLIFEIGLLDVDERLSMGMQHLTAQAVIEYFVTRGHYLFGFDAKAIPKGTVYVLAAGKAQARLLSSLGFRQAEVLSDPLPDGKTVLKADLESMIRGLIVRLKGSEFKTQDIWSTRENKYTHSLYLKWRENAMARGMQKTGIGFTAGRFSDPISETEYLEKLIPRYSLLDLGDDALTFSSTIDTDDIQWTPRIDFWTTESFDEFEFYEPPQNLDHIETSLSHWSEFKRKLSSYEERMIRTRTRNQMFGF